MEIYTACIEHNNNTLIKKSGTSLAGLQAWLLSLLDGEYDREEGIIYKYETTGQKIKIQSHRKTTIC